MDWRFITPILALFLGLALIVLLRRFQKSPVGTVGEEGTEELDRMGLLQHLDELRRRLFHAVAAFMVTFLACFGFSESIYEFLARPIYRVLPEGERLVFLRVTDPFILYFKVAALAGIFLASPIILYQVWGFIAPGLYRKEKSLAIPFIFFGSLLFIGGGAFAYYIAFPFAVEFLVGVGKNFEAQITVTNYLSFLMTVMLGLGLMFEMPTVIFLLAKLGVVTPRFLLRNFRWAVLIIFVIAAVITPTPDIVNLCVFALPTIGLYLVGVAVAAVFAPPKKKEAESESAPQGEA